MTKLIRVLIADDHPIVRQGLDGLITGRYGMIVVGQARDGQEVVEQARRLNPDVILMDLVMPGKSGIEAILEIKREETESRILVLTSFGDEERIAAAIKAGALGYLLKDSPPDELIHAIKQVSQGNMYLPRGVVLQWRRILEQDEPETDTAAIPLTEREIEVLKLVAGGLSNKEIASRLDVSDVTIRFHVSRILHRLDLDNRVQAAVYAVQKGLAVST